ncbi:hypothetical protein O6H91_23G052500 [Diphasiastrum complanatum]|nr:hypothetical protein O6H91_23G052500 [Diphasiastrum complanatum]
MTRWEALNNFFKQTGSKLAFGLSASYGRENNLNSGNWDPSNTQNLISFTASQGYDIFAWELGNELLGSIPPSRYASDVKTFRGIIDNVYGSSSNKPLLVAPDAVFNKDLYRQFLQSSRPNDIDVCTAHIYNIGPATDPIGVLEDRILNPTVLNYERTAFNNMNNLLKAHGSWTKPGVGEAGGIFHGGAHLVSDAFLNSFWYTDQMGEAATFGNHFYCRQTLVGFYYGLLDTTTLRPNPDFYSAKLWTDLMGNNVLPAIVTGSPYLRAYSHCSKGDTASATVILINLSKTTDFSVKLILSGSNGCQGTSGCQRLEYHLTAPQGNLHSRTIMLNGNILDLLPDDQLPDMNPRVVDSSTPISVVRTSIVYVKLVNVSLPACSQA